MNRIESARWNLKNGHGFIVAMPGVVMVMRGTVDGYGRGESVGNRQAALDWSIWFGRCARPHDRNAMDAAIRFAWPDGES